jgi:hypothetical protein
MKREKQERGNPIEFQCPNCGGNTLMDVCTGFTRYMVIRAIFDDGHVNDDSEIEFEDDGDCRGSYQCCDCRFELTTAEGRRVVTEEDLVTWIIDNCPQDTGVHGSSL